MSDKPLYLEDLSVGMTFAAGPMKIGEADIVAFAKEFDPQPFHTDPEAAENTIFKGLAASGWHTRALTMRMMVGRVKLAGGISRLWRRDFLAGSGPARRRAFRRMRDYGDRPIALEAQPSRGHA